ncbi:Stp1/IreP family PP2C-type Ser/Thr phosphatase [Planococcus sp. CAU13]|uniref:Stp1/IreP family PP2C-type Ser/Thr phosphatase n=1 Tax=Planococcus sp. CAU13 TaxID=1541197 RepID=UPI001F43F6D6|nr:Stp1/IreP family PP2C-type Ser/Thr phosphatase [Planococcus sp. CAU13]
MFHYVMESDTGKKREVNEDRVAVLHRPDGLMLVLVADGMGGHKAGDVASEMTVAAMGSLFMKADRENFLSVDSKKMWLDEKIRLINREVYEYAGDHPECKGMGTTLIAALIEGNSCVICHIGDSRVYTFNGKAEQITRDHSYVNVLVDNGEISEEEAEDHPKKNWIVRALGTEPGIEGEMLELELSESAYLLICSDGLSNKMSKEEIAEILRSEAALSQKGKDLVDLANEKGGEDNISFVLLASKAGEV